MVGGLDLLNHGPFPEELKRNLINLIVSAAHPVLTDISVFIMMLSLVIFDGHQEPEVKEINLHYQTMLCRYLNRTPTCESFGPNTALSAIFNCIKIIPQVVESYPGM